MAKNSQNIRKSIHLTPQPNATELQKGDMAVDASDSDNLVFNRDGNTPQRVILQEHVDAPGFTDASNVDYNNTSSGLTATTVQAAIDEIEARDDNQEQDVADLVTLSGVAVNSVDLGTFTGTTIADSSTIKEALQDLETAVELSGGDAADVAEDVGHLVTLSGVAVDSDDLGTFTGTTIPDASTVKGALQSIETSLETKQAQDSDLDAIAALSSNGIIAKTGAGTASVRAIQGTANQVAVADGDGVAANPVISIVPDAILPGDGAVTVPTGTDAQRPSSPTDGMFRFNTTANQFEGYSNSAWGAIAGSGGGDKNYIKADDGNTLTGWSTYKDAAGALPVDGTGGTASVTFTTTSSSPLSGLSSFLFTKPASDCQGEGVSYDFNIDDEDNCSAASIRASVKINSGTYADGDLTFYIVNKTTGEVVQPTAFKVMNAIGAYKSQPAEFQFATNTAYRLCIHVASTSAVAYTVMFDSVMVTPTRIVQGSVITDWQDYTPTFNVGTWTVSKSQWRRVGNIMEIDIKAIQTANLSATGTLFTFTLPAGASTAPSVALSDLSNAILVGSTVTGDRLGYGAGCGGVAGTIAFLAKTPTTLAVAITDGLHMGYSSWTGKEPTRWFGLGTTNSSGAGTISNDYGFSGLIRIPIAGWGASTVMSSESSGRVVAFRATSNSTASLSPTALELTAGWSTVSDSHNAFNASNGKYTIPETGFYIFKGGTIVLGAPSTVIELALRKNGSVVVGLDRSTSATPNGETVPLYLNAGDVMSLEGYSAVGTYAQGGAAVWQFFGGHKVNAPTQIAASEVVYGLVRKKNAFSIASGPTYVKIPGYTVEQDSHGCFNVGTSSLVIPRAGVLTVTGTASVNITSDALRVNLFLNGGVVRAAKVPPAVNYAYCEVTFTYKVKAGDIISLQVSQSSGSSASIDIDPGWEPTINWKLT